MKRYAIWGIVLCLLIGLGIFAGKPAYGKLKQWRAERLAKNATALLAENNVTAAREKAQAALLLSPRNVDAIRVMAQALTRETNAAALQFWGQLIQMGAADTADRRIFVEQSLRAGAAAVAGQELQKLLKEAPENAANLWLASQWFALTGNRTQALEYVSLAAFREPTNHQYRLFLSRLQCDSQQATEREAARAYVWARAREKDALGMDALMFLAQRSDLKPEERAELITLLQQHPAQNISHELIVLTLRILNESGRRQAILDEALAHYAKEAPEKRLRFAIWLSHNGENEKTLVALPLEEALSRKDFFLVYADAMAALNRWAELQKILETQKPSMEATYLEVFLARCDEQLHQASRAEPHWRAALRAAEGNPEQLLWLGRYAEKSNQMEIARQAYRSLIASVNNSLPAFRELQRLTDKVGTTAELRDLLGEMTRRWPSDASLQNDYAYLNLLLGAELAGSHLTANRLVAQVPDNLPFRTTLALALYRKQDFKAALGVYSGKEYHWPDAQPYQRAIYATVLAANALTADSDRILKGLPVERLRPEEKTLIQHLKR